MENPTYDILDQIAVLGKRGVWTKELNLVRWNNKWDKYDIRDWTSDHMTMSKGITLTRDELITLKSFLEFYEI